MNSKRSPLYVDTRKNKPFHCDSCGDSYEPCKCWDSPALAIEAATAAGFTVEKETV